MSGGRPPHLPGAPLGYRVGGDPAGAFTEFMRAFHALHDGSFTEAPTTLGPSSYALLAARARGDGLSVLDLGCGSGRLLEILAAEGRGRRLTGVDLVPEQVARARRRLAGLPVVLHAAEAGALPLPDASVDRVLVHMSLALMRPLEAALAEIDRVLRPGGRLAAVIDGVPRADALDRAYGAMLWRRVTAERPEIAGVPLAERRACDPAALASVLRARTGLTEVVEVRPFELLLSVTASEFVEFAEGDHLWKLLSPVGAEAMRAEVRALFPEGDARRVEVPIAMCLVEFAKPGPD